MLKVNEVIKCQVTGFKSYGIFVKLNNGYSGLIHISEISPSFVKDVRDYVEIGDYIYAKVMEIDTIHKHLKLSIKGLNYKVNGKKIADLSNRGFEPLKNNLNIWINDKLKEFNDN